MVAITSVGIIASTTDEGHLTYCENVETPSKYTTEDTINCSIDNLDNAALITFFNTNCVG